MRQAITATLFIALLTTACRSAPPTQRVVILGIDGATWRAMDPLIEKGLLPTFAAARQSGVTGDLLSLPPYNSPQMWTSIATGQPPEVHGIRSFVMKTEDGRRVPCSSNLRQVAAAWNIASDHQRSVGVVGWYVTWPAEEVNGFVVSDHVRPAEESPVFWPVTAEQEDRLVRRTYPEELLSEVESHLVDESEVTREEMKEDLGFFGLKHPFLGDELYMRLGLGLLTRHRPDLFLLYQHGTDVMQHLSYGPFDEWIQGREEESRASRRVVGYYQYQDDNLRRLIEALGGSVADTSLTLPAGTSILIVSDHGFGPGSRPRQPALTGDHLPEGILVMLGDPFPPAGRVEGATVLDVLPTTLHLLGIPRARDLPGRVLDDAMVPPFRPAPPPSLDTHPFTPEGGEAIPSPLDDSIVDELQALGYIE